MVPNDLLLNAETKTDLLDYKQQVDQYIRIKEHSLSAFSFVNVFSWKDFFRFRIKLINGQLCIFASDELTSFLYLPPLGKEVCQDTIDACFDQLDEFNVNREISRIENVTVNQLQYFPRDRFKIYKKGHEYLYFKKDLINLKGNAYKSKRASYNQFVNNNRYQ
jgi:hypothetical protein